MDPLTALIIALAATASVADANNAWRRRDQLDQVRRRLGLWPAEGFGPGSLVGRYQWIESQFGIRAAIWAKRAADLLNPQALHRFYEEEGPFLPWLAWRLSKGDAPEVVRVLEAPSFRPQDKLETGSKDADYSYDQAWSDLTRLFEWFQGARPSLFEHTWKSAKEAEEDWYESQIEYPAEWELYERPFLAWRDPVREDEDGDWIWVRIDHSADMLELLSRLRANASGHGSGYTLYVLLDPELTPQAGILEYDRQKRPTQIFADEMDDWELDTDDPVVTRTYQFMLKEWPNISTWPGSKGPILAFSMVATDDDKVIELLEEHPELLGEGPQSIGTHIAGSAYEWFSYKVIDKWAHMANTDPGHFNDLYAEIAASQCPSLAVAKYLDTGQWDHDLIEKKWEHYPTQIPPILHQYTVQDPDADLTDMHQGTYDQVLPWELRVWDIYRHPSGAELEVKVQGYIIYEPDTLAWVVVMQRGTRFKLDPMDQSTWSESDDLDTFEFIDIAPEETRWGRTQRHINDQRVKQVLNYRGPFDEITTTHSLDHALRELWEAFVDTLDDVPPDDPDADKLMRSYFAPQDLLEPRDHIEVQDMFETMALLDR